MTSYERLMARIALIRRSGTGQLPTKKQAPPTGGGETRSRAPEIVSPAKPPDAVGPATPTPAPAAAAPRFRKQCKAVDGVTGRRCRLLEHSDKTPHASERGEFVVVARPGQATFEHHQALELASVRNPGDPNHV